MDGLKHAYKYTHQYTHIDGWMGGWVDGWMMVCLPSYGVFGHSESERESKN